jgi:hypothetical protein
MESGAVIDINIPIRNPEVNIKEIVVWCNPCDDGLYDVGVRFVDAGQHFRMRMVEQVCHIEHFKRDILEKEGRNLSGEAAAMEWIRRFAKHFPK